MLLAIDIGNTNMEFGVFDKEKLIGSFRLGTNREITSDEVGLFTSQFFSINNIDRRQIDDIIIASVVPQVMYSINNAMKKYFYKKKPLVIGDNLFLKIKNSYDHPAEVGTDRLVAAIGAYHKYGGPLIVVVRHRNHLRRNRSRGCLSGGSYLPWGKNLHGSAVSKGGQTSSGRTA